MIRVDLTNTAPTNICRRCRGINPNFGKSHFCEDCSEIIYNSELENNVTCIYCKTRFKYKDKKYHGKRLYVYVSCKRCIIRIRNKKRLERTSKFCRWAKYTLKSHKKRGHIVNISEEDLVTLAQQTVVCPICGVVLRYSTSDAGVGATASMDRIFNGDSYALKDVAIICHRCNSLKGNIDFEYFKRITQGFVRYVRKIEPDFSP